MLKLPAPDRTIVDLQLIQGDATGRRCIADDGQQITPTNVPNSTVDAPRLVLAAHLDGLVTNVNSATSPSGTDLPFARCRAREQGRQGLLEAGIERTAFQRRSPSSTRAGQMPDCHGLGDLVDVVDGEAARASRARSGVTRRRSSATCSTRRSSSPRTSFRALLRAEAGERRSWPARCRWPPATSSLVRIWMAGDGLHGLGTYRHRRFLREFAFEPRLAAVGYRWLFVERHRQS